jgi:DNA recombination protein RmuC
VLPSARKLNVLDESKTIPALLPLEDSARDLAAVEMVTALDDGEVSVRGTLEAGALGAESAVPQDVRDRADADALPNVDRSA